MRTNATRVETSGTEHCVVLKVFKGEMWKEFYLDRDEARMLLGHLPMTFKDISHFGTFYSDAFVYVEAHDRDRAEWTWFIMPVRRAVFPGIQAILDGDDKWQMEEAAMMKLAAKWWPVTRFVYRVDSYIDTRRLVVEHVDAPRLKECLKSVLAIARNASDGDRVQIHVSLDGWGNMAGRRGEPPYERPSFYWWIEKNGKQYMNGGIIWHGDSYSVHT